ncbi:DUF1127 domain-containing protein [Bosea sp. F3-2]|uniref:DUF1127 domain-containing protein n=1 Tax=Bosea sp. F3-2 TaxID=2599640 RepID=UPI0011ECCA8A|nr:DUF1127 domain-containing protein [Bosea sp. F3-2]QEL25296.1 DUF1127 domain-containing protein [Bosea sp. F3-2]
MHVSPAIAGLSFSAARRSSGRALGLLLQLEAWLDARSSARALYAMDDRALSDLGLSRSDVERVNADTSRTVGAA